MVPTLMFVVSGVTLMVSSVAVAACGAPPPPLQAAIVKSVLRITRYFTQEYFVSITFPYNQT